MVNSHLLYQLSYRGSEGAGILPGQCLPGPAGAQVISNRHSACKSFASGEKSVSRSGDEGQQVRFDHDAMVLRSPFEADRL